MSEESLSNADAVRQLRAEYQRGLSELKTLLLPDGFAQVGPPQVVFCNVTRGSGTGWYTLDDAGNPLPLAPEFYGFIEWLRVFQDANRRNAWKFRLHMKTRSGQRFYFESGSNAFFAKTAIASIAQTPPEYLGYLIKIHSWVKNIEKGKNAGEKTLACAFSLPTFAYRLDGSWNGDTNFNALLQQADLHIQKATGKQRQGGIDSYE